MENMRCPACGGESFFLKVETFMITAICISSSMGEEGFVPCGAQVALTRVVEQE